MVEFGYWPLGYLSRVIMHHTGHNLLPIKTIHLAASTMDGFQGDTSNKKHVSVKATTPRIMNISVASHSWGKSGVTHTSGCPSDFWHMTVRPSRTEPSKNMIATMQM